MILTETDYLRAYYITVAYALLTILGVLFIGSMAAFRVRALRDFWQKRLLFGLVMLVADGADRGNDHSDLSSRMPEIWSWLNTMRGLVVPGLASAFGLFMLVQFMRTFADGND